MLDCVSKLLQIMVVFILETPQIPSERMEVFILQIAVPQIVDSAFEKRRRRLELRSHPSQDRRCRKDVKISQG